LLGEEGTLDEARAVRDLALVGRVRVHDLTSAWYTKIAGSSCRLGKEEEEVTIPDGSCVGKQQVGGGDSQHLLKVVCICIGWELRLNGAKTAIVGLRAKGRPKGRDRIEAIVVAENIGVGVRGELRTTGRVEGRDFSTEQAVGARCVDVGRAKASECRSDLGS